MKKFQGAEALQFVVPGEAVPKARPRHARIKSKRGGDRVVTYTPKATETWEAYVRWFAFQAMNGRGLISGPLHVDIHAHYRIPESWPRWKREAAEAGHVGHTKRPDKDNVAKAILDAINGVVYADDSQVVSSTEAKLFTPDDPHVVVCVRRLHMIPSNAGRKDYDQLLLEVGHG